MFSRDVVLAALLLGSVTGSAFAQPPAPAPDPTGPPNVFYGAVPPSPVYPTGPVMVFVHGLHGTAMDWWTGNTAYQMAFTAGFRTAFISLNADNTPNDATIDANATVLKALLPAISQHFGGAKMYLVGHSKGGIDIQAALMSPLIRPLVRGVFTISSPNYGSELADWAFGPGVAVAGELGLLTPGVFAIRTANLAVFRQLADPILKASGIPFYTLGGDKSTTNPLTAITGAILTQQSGGQFRNDGFVTIDSARLPDDYAVDLGTVHTDHFSIDNGDQSFSKINGRVQGMELQFAEFERVVKGGFAESNNTWLWSQTWFKGKLYVGTGREIQCMSLLTSDVQQGTNIYPLSVLAGDCPAANVLSASLSAEIWRYDPADGSWLRVFKSPENIVVGTDEEGGVRFSARDVGFRGMASFVEPDGTEALYVGGVTSGSIHDVGEMFPNGYPPPRLLRSVDGVNFGAVPQTPGTFLGDIANPQPGSDRRMRSFRALTVYDNRLFVSVADFRGVGFVIASSSPQLGNNAWVRVSPLPEEFPVWNLIVYNGFLYATTGDKDFDTDGYGVYKTDATGLPPYQWQPVVVNGGYQSDSRVRGPNGLSFAEFRGQLYVGTNRPTELIRINADDTWDLLVGEPRDTPHGHKTPLSGLGIGFGSWFNGHFWRMGVHGQYLYLTTWDWSVSLRFISNIDQIFNHHYGFDLYRSSDGVRWEAVTRTGFDDGVNSGGRSIMSTEAGLFVGTARPDGGASLYRCQHASCGDPAVEPPGMLIASPKQLYAESEQTAGRTAMLTWDPVPGAVRYRVYRATALGLPTFLPGAFQSFPVPGIGDVTIEDIRNGVLDFLCTPTTEQICMFIDAIKTSPLPDVPMSLPSPFVQVRVTAGTSFIEPAPTEYQSLYIVRAEDAAGNLSRPSNFVGAPSKTAPMVADETPPEVTPVFSATPSAAGWFNAAVTVSWNVADPETGVGSLNGCGPVVLSADTPGVTLVCHATNGRGLPTTASTTVKVDMTPPTITWLAPTTAANEHGWRRADFSLAFTVADALSGVAPGGTPSPLLISGEGANVTAVATVSDLAGNVAHVVSPGAKIDKTAPEATVRFNPLSFDVAVIGRDALSGSPTQPVASQRSYKSWWGKRDNDDDEKEERRGNHRTERRNYVVTDLAGNQSTIVLEVKRGHTLLRAEVLSIRYGDGKPMRVPQNRLRFDWSLAKKTKLLDALDQTVRVRDGRWRDVVEAIYQVRRAETRIKVMKPKPRQRTIFGGLMLLRLETANGDISVEFGL
jgi:hypothetical protein